MQTTSSIDEINSKQETSSKINDTQQTKHTKKKSTQDQTLNSTNYNPSKIDEITGNLNFFFSSLTDSITILETKIQLSQSTLSKIESKDLQTKTNSTKSAKENYKLTVQPAHKENHTPQTKQKENITTKVLSALKLIKENSKQFTITSATALATLLSKETNALELYTKVQYTRLEQIHNQIKQHIEEEPIESNKNIFEILPKLIIGFTKFFDAIFEIYANSCITTEKSTNPIYTSNTFSKYSTAYIVTILNFTTVWEQLSEEISQEEKVSTSQLSADNTLNNKNPHSNILQEIFPYLQSYIFIQFSLKKTQAQQVQDLAIFIITILNKLQSNIVSPTDIMNYIILLLRWCNFCNNNATSTLMSILSKEQEKQERLKKIKTQHSSKKDKKEKLKKENNILSEYTENDKNIKNLGNKIIIMQMIGCLSKHINNIICENQHLEEQINAYNYLISNLVTILNTHNIKTIPLYTHTQNHEQSFMAKRKQEYLKKLDTYSETININSLSIEDFPLKTRLDWLQIYEKLFFIKKDEKTNTINESLRIEKTILIRTIASITQFICNLTAEQTHKQKIMTGVFTLVKNIIQKDTGEIEVEDYLILPNILLQHADKINNLEQQQYFYDQALTAQLFSLISHKLSIEYKTLILTQILNNIHKISNIKKKEGYLENLLEVIQAEYIISQQADIKQKETILIEIKKLIEKIESTIAKDKDKSKYSLKFNNQKKQLYQKINTNDEKAMQVKKETKKPLQKSTHLINVETISNLIADNSIMKSLTNLKIQRVILSTLKSTTKKTKIKKSTLQALRYFEKTTFFKFLEQEIKKNSQESKKSRDISITTAKKEIIIMKEDLLTLQVTVKEKYKKSLAKYEYLFKKFQKIQKSVSEKQLNITKTKNDKSIDLCVEQEIQFLNLIKEEQQSEKNKKEIQKLLSYFTGEEFKSLNKSYTKEIATQNLETKTQDKFTYNIQDINSELQKINSINIQKNMQKKPMSTSSAAQNITLSQIEKKLDENITKTIHEYMFSNDILVYSFKESFRQLITDISSSFTIYFKKYYDELEKEQKEKEILEKEKKYLKSIDISIKESIPSIEDKIKKLEEEESTITKAIETYQIHINELEENQRTLNRKIKKYKEKKSAFTKLQEYLSNKKTCNNTSKKSGDNKEKKEAVTTAKYSNTDLSTQGKNQKKQENSSHNETIHCSEEIRSNPSTAETTTKEENKNSKETSISTNNSTTNSLEQSSLSDLPGSLEEPNSSSNAGETLTKEEKKKNKETKKTTAIINNLTHQTCLSSLSSPLERTNLAPSTATVSTEENKNSNKSCKTTILESNSKLIASEHTLSSFSEEYNRSILKKMQAQSSTTVKEIEEFKELKNILIETIQSGIVVIEKHPEIVLTSNTKCLTKEESQIKQARCEIKASLALVKQSFEQRKKKFKESSKLSSSDIHEKIKQTYIEIFLEKIADTNNFYMFWYLSTSLKLINIILPENLSFNTYYNRALADTFVQFSQLIEQNSVLFHSEEDIANEKQRIFTILISFVLLTYDLSKEKYNIAIRNTKNEIKISWKTMIDYTSAVNINPQIDKHTPNNILNIAAYNAIQNLKQNILLWQQQDFFVQTQQQELIYTHQVLTTTQQQGLFTHNHISHPSTHQEFIPHTQRLFKPKNQAKLNQHQEFMPCKQPQGLVTQKQKINNGNKSKLKKTHK